MKINGKIIGGNDEPKDYVESIVDDIRLEIDNKIESQKYNDSDIITLALNATYFLTPNSLPALRKYNREFLLNEAKEYIRGVYGRKYRLLKHLTDEINYYEIFVLSRID